MKVAGFSIQWEAISASNPAASPSPSPKSVPAGPAGCLLSEWSDWSMCSATCGGGIQYQTRTVLAPPDEGGEPCGALVQEQECGVTTCYSWNPDIDCELGDAQPTGNCTQSCGTEGK